MKSPQFQALLGQIETLTRAQSERLVTALLAQKSAKESARTLNQYEPKSCPHCQHKKLGRNGTQNGFQRYRCSACARTSTVVTGTPLARLKDKSKLAAYAECMAEGLTLHATAYRLDITVQKAFRWRHAILARQVGHQPEPITGVLEIDETYFARSYKGSRAMSAARKRGHDIEGSGRKSQDFVPVLVGRARGQKLVVDCVMKNMRQKTVAAALEPSIYPGRTVLHMDKSRSFMSLPKLLKVQGHRFKASRNKSTKNVHVQSVNSYHQQLKNSLNVVFRGVATKYLPHYLAWQRLRHWAENPLPAEVYIGSALGHQLINLRS